MKSNVGGMDRTLRIIVGLVLIVLATLEMTGVASIGFGIGLWGWVGAVPLLTGLFRFCPFYPILGLNTCPMKK